MDLAKLHGSSQASSINIHMPKYLMPKAHCKDTGQSVKSNDLGKKFRLDQRVDAGREATRLAEQMTFKTGRRWTGLVEEYTVDAWGRTQL